MSNYRDTSRGAGKLLERMRGGGYVRPDDDRREDIAELERKGYIKRDQNGDAYVTERGRRANDDGAAGW